MESIPRCLIAFIVIVHFVIVVAAAVYIMYILCKCFASSFQGLHMHTHIFNMNYTNNV